MSQSILIYGATGYSGRLIAHEARRASGRNGPRIVLGARDGHALEKLAGALDVDMRVFGLDTARPVMQALDGIEVVLNAAGPFARTAERLAKAAIDLGCHYVDISGELDVYKRLDDLARFARQRSVMLVSGAGHTAAASDLLLHEALAAIERTRGPSQALGSIRIAMSPPNDFSRGSAESAWRSIREQVAVVRGLEASPASDAPTLRHVPAGMLERSFDFALGERPDFRAATAANLIDTMTARITALRHGVSVREIESYVQMGDTARLAYHALSLAAPVLATRWSRALAEAGLGMLPAGPDARQRQLARQTVVLRIEGDTNQPLIDWRLQTPHAYTFTAWAAWAVAAALLMRTADVDERKQPRHPAAGWLTPGDLLFRAGHRFDMSAGGPSPTRVQKVPDCDLFKREVEP